MSTSKDLIHSQLEDTKLILENQDPMPVKAKRIGIIGGRAIKAALNEVDSCDFFKLNEYFQAFILNVEDRKEIAKLEKELFQGDSQNELGILASKRKLKLLNMTNPMLYFFEIIYPFNTPIFLLKFSAFLNLILSVALLLAGLSSDIVAGILLAMHLTILFLWSIISFCYFSCCKPKMTTPIQPDQNQAGIEMKKMPEVSKTPEKTKLEVQSRCADPLLNSETTIQKEIPTNVSKVISLEQDKIVETPTIKAKFFAFFQNFTNTKEEYS